MKGKPPAATPTPPAFSPEALAGVFKRMTAGEAGAWQDFVATERPRLFDLSVRMTGQLNRSQESVNEVATVLHPLLAQYQTLSALRVEFYRTLRSFNADIWNADIRLLTHPGGESVRGPGGDGATDNLLRTARPDLREVLLLTQVCRFSVAEVATIMGVSESWVSEALSSFQEPLDKLFAQHQLIPLPVSSAHHTADLSVLIQELRETRLSWAGRHKWVLIALLAIAIVAAYVIMS